MPKPMPDTRPIPDDAHQHLRDLIDVLSHELRQPIAQASAAVDAALAALASGLQPDGAHQHAETTLARSRKTLQAAQAHIDNTVTIASLLLADGPVHRQDCDVDLMIALAVGDMTAQDAGRIHIERLTATRTAAMEPHLMRLALRNLLSNALKFSPPGSPVVVQVADSDEPLALLIDVIDRGVGVDEHLLPYLFDKRIRQAEGANGLGGLGRCGLGLHIVRQIMARHGGGAELVRTGGHGSTFRLSLIQGLPT